MRTLILRSLAGTAIFALVFGAIHWNRNTGPGMDARALSSRESAPEKSAAPPRAASSAALTAAPGPAVSAEAPPREPSAAKTPERSKALADYAYRADIESFHDLSKKVFLTDDEKRRKRELLENDGFLKSLPQLLKVGAGGDAEMKRAQDAALDVLFESLRTDAHSPVAEVLIEIVGDNQIENEQLDMVTKRDLAGVKAEVLYYWSSMDPASAGRIEQSLPGPVSRKIWENVVSAQKNNLEESAIEAARYPSSVGEL